MSNDFALDPMREYPDSIIIYQLKIDGVPVVSVQVDTKRKIMIMRNIKQ